MKTLENKLMYNELLLKSGRSLLNVKEFINTIETTGLFPKNNLNNVKEFLLKKLLPHDAESVIEEYTKVIKRQKLKTKEIDVSWTEEEFEEALNAIKNFKI